MEGQSTVKKENRGAARTAKSVRDKRRVRPLASVPFRGFAEGERTSEECLGCALLVHLHAGRPPPRQLSSLTLLSVAFVAAPLFDPTDFPFPFEESASRLLRLHLNLLGI